MSSDDDFPVGDIDAQAAAWVVRHDGQPLGEEEQRAFDGWVADPYHDAAYRRHLAIWQRYRQAGAQLPPLAPRYARRRSAVPARQRRRSLRGRTAAVIAASLAVLAVTQVGAMSIWLRADYGTSAGERRSITLADGSTVRLDGRSAIAVSETRGRRTVRLLEGAAFFDVAPDTTRPFVVETQRGSVIALGTAFAIRDREKADELVVTEHSVRVATEGGHTAVVTEGKSASFAADGVSVPARSDVAAATAWTRGKLVVVDRPLAEVVDEIGRQRRGYWTVRGDAAAIRVSGVYDLDQPLAALDALEKTLNLSSFRLSDRVIILSH